MAYSPQARRDRINPHFPKLVEMTRDYVYADVWERPGLSKRDRSIVTIAALTALGWRDQLEGHGCGPLGWSVALGYNALLCGHIGPLRRSAQNQDSPAGRI